MDIILPVFCPQLTFLLAFRLWLSVGLIGLSSTDFITKIGVTVKINTLSAMSSFNMAKTHKSNCMLFIMINISAL